MLPLVAIVGRPNVGKSTLFNRLAGRRLAIVDDAPGVTRDRHYADAHLHGRDLTLVDTGGFDPTTEDPMGRGIARHVRAAIDEADVIVCVLDASGPPTEPDREAVRLLRQSRKPVVFVANKADSRERELESSEHYTLGIAELLPISALHGRGIAELEAAVVGALPPPAPPEPAPAVPRVALIGRPNAGKSSLLNRFAGDERSLVDDRPGTTRDPVDSLVRVAGQDLLVVDTAGIRRRARVDRGVEAASVMRAIRSMGRADVVVLVCDAAAGVAEQDARLFALAAERGRAIVVALNKIDLVRSKQPRAEAEQSARDALRFAPWAPIVPVSAKTGHGVAELARAVARATDEFERRVPTAALNRFFEQVLERRSPPTRGGRAPRIYYITQAETAPPVFVAMSNAPGAIQDSYRRFVVNQIRKAFGFECVPVVVRYKKKTSR
jgi:GTPase